MLGLALSRLWVKVVGWFPQLFPIKMVYLSASILIFGGGAQVASSMFNMMLADSHSDEEMHLRRTNMVEQILLVFSVATLSRQAIALLLQYATKKYHWSYSKVNSSPLTFFSQPSIAEVSKGYYSSISSWNR
jgi:hypothetical protein